MFASSTGAYIEQGAEDFVNPLWLNLAADVDQREGPPAELTIDGRHYKRLFLKPREGTHGT